MDNNWMELEGIRGSMIFGVGKRRGSVLALNYQRHEMLIQRGIEEQMKDIILYRTMNYKRKDMEIVEYLTNDNNFDNNFEVVAILRYM